jgi:hypothetical protein
MLINCYVIRKCEVLTYLPNSGDIPPKTQDELVQALDAAWFSTPPVSIFILYGYKTRKDTKGSAKIR